MNSPRKGAADIDAGGVARARSEYADPHQLQVFETKLMDHWRVKVGWNRMLNIDPECKPCRGDE